MSSIINGTSLNKMTHNGHKVKTWIHNGVEVFRAEKIIWTELPFSNSKHGSGSYSITKETIQDLTHFGDLYISVNVTFNGLYRGSNDYISLFIDDTEYVLVNNEWLDGEHTISETIDISELSGEHTIKLYVKSNSASDVYWGSFAGTADLKLFN